MAADEDLDLDDPELIAALAASRETAREESELRAAIAASLKPAIRPPSPAETMVYDDPMPRWTVDLGADGFQPYDESTSCRIERAHAAGDKDVTVHAAGKQYRIDFATMRQVDARDPHKRRSVRREGGGGTASVTPTTPTPATAARPRHHSRISSAAGLTTEGHTGRTMELWHETDEDCARLIQGSQHMKTSPDVYPDGRRSLFGPLIYFAQSADAAAKKAHKHGVILRATVAVGISVVVTKDEAKGGQRYTPDALRAIGCDSVKGTGMSTGIEWCVANSDLVSSIRVADYIGYSAGTSQLAPQPWWLWPMWVQKLADTIGVVDAVVECTADRSGDKDRHTVKTVNGVRVNSAGRPIKDNGQFMSYAEARSKGWKAESHRHSVSSRPTGPLKADGSPDMRYKANRASPSVAGGGSTSSLRHSVSSHPTGPLKADGSPDMRCKANRASPSVAGGGSASSLRHSVSSHPTGPLKADGSPDMRYKANRTAGGGSYSPIDFRSTSYGSSSSSSPSSLGLGGSGASASRSYGGMGYGVGGHGGCGASNGGGFSGSRCHQVSSNPMGPLKADGTPDMRYAANRR